jgi:hypothetical protein
MICIRDMWYVAAVALYLRLYTRVNPRLLKDIAELRVTRTAESLEESIRDHDASDICIRFIEGLLKIEDLEKALL